MWSYKLVNFPFGKEEKSDEREINIFKITSQSPKPKLQKKKSFVKDPLWDLFNQIKDL